ncbi:MAG: dihydrodipicolinate synthase family protein [Chloroflexi bacterium]|nr:dihydrodipicolinate synthase family protein [Chloroflexota bacterium]MCY3581392.1 dihydrodipicolinate synthase family protein [Chloroflexota bacterium]MCY3717537.1 dihydrodipicolinate synthase family protein [Chloroflexota bacterium]MDE2651954.1 dihydrodipicolinate synthase family protein [Chloroflexota bacterium]MYA92262.1 dihydrodipicolinate synthase family protein [Chloroflexota bacterium]
MTDARPRCPQAILVSCEIPWGEDKTLLEDVFRRSVRATLEHFNHLYIFGTAGEGYAVNQAQFQRIVDIFHEETRGEGIYPMVGLIGLSTPIVLEKLQYAYDRGFRRFQVSLPAWGALTDAEVMTFFRDVCGAFPTAQFLHYNLPRAGRVLEARHYRPLVDALPNLVATKNTGGGHKRAAELVSQVGELQHFLGEGNFLQGCMYGECSLLASFGSLSPQKVKAYFAAAQAQDFPLMLRLQRGFHDMLAALFTALAGEGKIDGAYDKMWVKLGGFEDMPLRLLSPYHGFSEEQFRSCKRLLRRDYAEWLAD